MADKIAFPYNLQSTARNCGLYCNWVFYTGVYKNKLFYTRKRNDENWTNITREKGWERENSFECKHP